MNAPPGRPPGEWSHDAVEHLLQLEIAQDHVTWLTLSLFIVAQAVLLGPSLATGIDKSFRLLAIAAGFLLNSSSLLLVWRSNAWMVEYWRHLRSPDRPEFNLNLPPPSARAFILILHIGLFVVWAVFLGMVVVRP